MLESCEKRAGGGAHTPSLTPTVVEQAYYHHRYDRTHGWKPSSTHAPQHVRKNRARTPPVQCWECDVARHRQHIVRLGRLLGSYPKRGTEAGVSPVRSGPIPLQAPQAVLGGPIFVFRDCRKDGGSTGRAHAMGKLRPGLLLPHDGFAETQWSDCAAAKPMCDRAPTPAVDDR
jgi:hypothetical protein